MRAKRPGPLTISIPPREVTAAEPSPYPPAKLAWMACLVLAAVSVVGFADRLVINLLIIPIQASLRINDTEISLLLGVAFSAANVLALLPVARLVDSRNRRNLMAVSLVAWSLMTAGCGAATSFLQMFLARSGVGAGESGLSPAATSMIADYFPPHRRATAIGLFYGGVSVGGGAAYLGGGLLLAWLAGRTSADLPLVGTVEPWRMVFFVLAAVGILLVAVVMLVPEPLRRDGDRPTAAGGVPVTAVLAFMRRHRSTLTCLMGGFTLLGFVTLATNAWLPTMMVRTHGWSLPQTGSALGAMLIVLGPLGSLTSGVLADALARRGRKDSKLLVAMLCGAGCALAILGAALSPSAGGALFAIGCFYFLGTFHFPLAPAALMEIAPNAMRGQMTALFFGVANIVGGLFAATSVALLTDYVFRAPEKVNLSLGVVGVSASAVSLILLFAGRRPFVRSAAQLASDA